MIIKTLNNGVKIPQVGLGVWKVENGQQAIDAILTAIQTGYRLIDTAAIYGNEEAVGEAIRQSPVPREELFITTKVWNADQGYEETLKAFETSMEKLGLDYLDLYLIHWPIAIYDTFIDTWKAMEKLYKDGRIKAIGVCNFQKDHLQRLIDECEVVPTINQIECHPYLSQEELKAYCKENGIQVEAWSPLMQGGDVLRLPIVMELAEKYGKTPAQIVLRWHIQHDVVVIPKSVTPSRIAENFDIFGFELSPEDMKAIDDVNCNWRAGAHPDEYKRK